MKWAEVRSSLKKKLHANVDKGKKHDTASVYCGAFYVGFVLLSHGEGEMKNHEIGNIADSLRINEFNFKHLVSCTISGEEYCAMVNPQQAAPA